MTLFQTIHIELELGSWVFPNFPIDERTTYEIELRKGGRTRIRGPRNGKNKRKHRARRI